MRLNSLYLLYKHENFAGVGEPSIVTTWITRVCSHINRFEDALCWVLYLFVVEAALKGEDKWIYGR